MTEPTKDRPGVVVVAEDDTPVREVIVRLLARAGYTVLSAVDGREALELIVGQHVDVLVSDVVMPGLAGPDLARLVRQRFPATGVVLITGYSPDSIDVADLLEGGARVVGKPFAAGDLIGAVEDVRARPPAV